jgi:hypothetical protein
MGTAMKIITPQVMGRSQRNGKECVDLDDEVSALSQIELLRSRSEWRYTVRNSHFGEAAELMANRMPHINTAREG